MDHLDGRKATFAYTDFLEHVGARTKGTPAFDAFDLSAGENNEFGTGTTKARHFTPYSLRRATGNATAQIDADLPATINLMNPMGRAREPGRRRQRADVLGRPARRQPGRR